MLFTNSWDSLRLVTELVTMRKWVAASLTGDEEKEKKNIIVKPKQHRSLMAPPTPICWNKHYDISTMMSSPHYDECWCLCTDVTVCEASTVLLWIFFKAIIQAFLKILTTRPSHLRHRCSDQQKKKQGLERLHIEGHDMSSKHTGCGDGAGAWTRSFTFCSLWNHIHHKPASARYYRCVISIDYVI